MAIEAHGQKILVRNEPDGVRFSFTLEGKISKQQIKVMPEKEPEIVFSDCEINLLRSFFNELQKYKVFEISDILRIIRQIPDTTENIINMKRQFSNVVFASNAELYDLLIKKILD
jgi:hypothetical protein